MISATDLHPPGERRLPIVGIGASAGGLEALEQFFAAVPPQSGIAFVIVQHMDPTRKGVLADLLQRGTGMKVQQARDGEKGKPDNVYVLLLGWPHTGFGTHVSRAIPAVVAGYMARLPITPKRVLGEADKDQIIYRSDAVHPQHQANFRVFDPLDFLAEGSAHIPDPHEKTALFSGLPRHWQAAATILAQFGPTPLRARRPYGDFVMAGVPKGRRPELQG